MDEDFKIGLAKKYQEFKRNGLKSYLAYVEKELANAEGKPNKRLYKEYLENEVYNAKKKLEKLK